jgi:hypothetical protein
MKPWMLVLAIASFTLNIVALAAVYFDAAFAAEIGKTNLLFWILVLDTVVEIPVVYIAAIQYNQYRSFVAKAIEEKTIRDAQPATN